MGMKQIGGSGLQIAPLALGTNVFGWTVTDDKVAFRILDAFVDGGFNLIDTADSYPRWAPGCKGGESEAMLGRWFKASARRKEVLLATKVGSDMGEGKNLRKDYIIRSADASLKRLCTDHIDLYQAHWDDPETPQDEAMEAFEGLIKAGKVRYIGASNFPPSRLRAALDLAEAKQKPAYVSFQTRYNLFSRAGYESHYEELCVTRHLGVLAYYALASGFLTGKYRSEADLAQSARGTSMPKYLNQRGLRILKALDKAAARQAAPQSAVSLAWLNTRPGVSAPIASATSLHQLQELMAGARLQLDQQDLKALEEASDLHPGDPQEPTTT